MKYKHIEASREARLWIGQVIVPAVVGGVMLLSNPEIRTQAVEMKNKLVGNIKSKFQKK